MSKTPVTYTKLPLYSSTNTYLTGEHVYVESVTDVSDGHYMSIASVPAGAWDSTKWQYIDNQHMIRANQPPSSNVWVGTTAPTGNEKIWINPSVTSNNGWYNKTEVDTLLTSKQNITESTLTTTNKTIPTAINELNANKQSNLPSVTNDRYLHTNAVDGHLEWSAAADGGDSASFQDNKLVFNAGTNTPIGANPAGVATQTLTKLMVDNTIYGIDAETGNVRYDKALSLTAEQKAVARNNMDVPSNTVVEPLINIWDEQWKLGTYRSSDGVYVNNTDRICSVNYTEVIGGASYYCKDGGAGTLYAYYWDSNRSYICGGGDYVIANSVFTVPSNAKYMKLAMQNTYGTTYNHDISINYPSTYTGYYPSGLPRAKAHIGGLGNAIGMRGWNQLSATKNWTNSITDTRGLFQNAVQVMNGASTVSNIFIENFSENRTSQRIFTANGNGDALKIKHNGSVHDIDIESVKAVIISGRKYYYSITCNGHNPATVGGISIPNINLIDLTALFGAGNEPSTVAEFRAMFPSDYYPYCPVQPIIYGGYSHNGIYRGKDITYLGVTEICNRIANGSFEDLYLGDYITLTTSYGTHDYILGGFDTKWRVYGLTQHHAIVFPRTNLTTAQMNTTNTTVGGYVGSAMFATTLPSVASAIQSAFNNRVISHYELLSTAINSSATNKNMLTGASSSWGWQSGRIVDLMSEIEVFGSQIFGNGFDSGTAKQRIPVFNFNPQLVTTGQDYWLKDVASSAHFASCLGSGNAAYDGASHSYGVRPCFLIG